MSLVQLVDSSEFHGTPEREWNYKLFKWRGLFMNLKNLKYIVYVILWFIVGRISLQYQLHGIFVILTGFALIFCNLGERQIGTMSAYSVFNNKYYNVIGTFTASDVDNMFIQRNKSNDANEQSTQELINEDKSEFDGLTEDQMMARLNKLGNRSQVQKMSLFFTTTGQTIRRGRRKVTQLKKEKNLMNFIICQILSQTILFQNLKIFVLCDSKSPVKFFSFNSRPKNNYQLIKEQDTMKYSSVFSFLSCVLSYASFSDYEEDDGIITLDEGNFENAIKEFPFIMVEFYAPWCSHCQKLEPEYKSVAKQLKGQNIVFAKIEAEKALNISAHYMIRGYPTLKLFRSGRPKNYDGNNQAYDIIQWLNFNAVPLVTLIQDRAELEIFKEQQTTILMYFAELDEPIKDQNTFAYMADQLEGIFLGHTQNQDMRRQLKLEDDDKIVLYSPHQEEPIKMHGEITLENIWYFVQNNSYPIISTYNAREKLFIEEMEHPAIYLFLDGVEKNIPEEQAFEKLANKLQGEILFVRMSKSEPEGRDAWIKNKFHDKFGVTDFPCVYIQDTRGYRPFKKYRLEGEINEETMTKFINDFKQGALKQFYKSQRVPTQKTLVREVVGLTFQEDVLDNEKDVLVLFNSLNSDSRHMQRVFEELSRKFNGLNANILLARIDGTENEIPDYNMETFPTIKLFRKIGPSKDELEVVEYKGDKTLIGIVEFLEDNATFPWIDLDGEQKQEQKSNDLINQKDSDNNESRNEVTDL